MRWTLFSRLGIFVLLCAAATDSQAQPGSTLQLPTFSSFSIGTSVLVPDGGGAQWGRVGRAYQGSSSYGPSGLPLNRAFGGGTGLSTMSVHAWIHDMHALDETVLAGPSAKQSTDPIVARYTSERRAVDGADRKTTTGSSTRRPGHEPAVESVATIRARRDQQKFAEENKKASEHFAAAERYEEEGKPSLAKMYYRMAGKTAKGDLRTEIIQRLNRLEPKSSSKAKSKADENQP